MKKHSYICAGYTLIELSIVLAIVGVMLASGITLLAQKSEAEKHRVTIDHLNEIEAAIQAFYDRNGRLPCPAYGDARIEDETAASGGEFGVEVAYDVDADQCVDIPNGARGVAPVRTLNLPDEVMFDGWGRKLSYQLASGAGNSDDFASQEFPGDISVRNMLGYELTTLNYVGNYGAVYVLFSHGKDGLRAWLPNVTGADAEFYIDTDVATTDALLGIEIENVDGDSSFVKDIPSQYFDDILRFKTKMEIESAKRDLSPIRIATRACHSARSVLDNLDDFADYEADVTNAAVGGYAAKSAAIQKAALVLDKLCNSGVASEVTTCATNMTWYEVADGKLYDDCYCATDGQFFSHALQDSDVFANCM